MNEPATGMIPAARMRFDRGRASHERYHNQYALLMAMGTRDGLLAAMPDLRTFVLSRAGFAGIQRYAANWMGDNMSRWDHLALSLPMAAGLGVSGQAFVGADIGGFAGHSNAELFLRWMQMGTLTPFCRNHSEIGNADQYAWAWGDVVLDARARRRSSCATGCCPTSTRRSCALRRPASRCSGRWSSITSTTPRCATSTTSTCSAATCSSPRWSPRASTARQVYLPAGDWYDWHTGKRLSGPALRDRGHADGPDPAVRARRRGHPDVAAGAAVDRRPPPVRDRAARVRPGRGRRLDVAAAGGRRPHDGGGFLRTTFTLERSGETSRCARRSATATRSTRASASSSSSTATRTWLRLTPEGTRWKATNTSPAAPITRRNRFTPLVSSSQAQTARPA